MVTPTQRIKNRIKKQNQMERQREWLLKNHGVCTTQALITKLMKMEKSNNG